MTRSLTKWLAVAAVLMFAVPVAAHAGARAGYGGEDGSRRPRAGDARDWAHKLTEDACKAVEVGAVSIINSKYRLRIPNAKCSLNSVSTSRCTSVLDRTAWKCNAAFTAYTNVAVKRAYWRCRKPHVIGWDRIGRIASLRFYKWKCRPIRERQSKVYSDRKVVRAREVTTARAGVGGELLP